MVTDALRKLRELFAFGLLAVAALYLVSGLSLLLKSEGDLGLDFPGGLGFAGKSAAFGYLFAHPVLIFCVVAAVAIVAYGTPTKHARLIALIGLALAGVALLLAVITWLASFAGTATGGLGLAGGVLGAGTIVGSLLGLAQLLLLALATWFSLAVFSALPKAARQTLAWGQAQGYGAQSPYEQPAWGQQQGGGYGQPQQGWTRPSVQPGWSGQPVVGPVPSATAAGWVMPEQGRPASAWVSADPAAGAAQQGQRGWSTGDQPPPQWYSETPTAGQWHDSPGSPPLEGQQHWTHQEPALEGGQQPWVHSEPDPPLDGGQTHWTQSEPGAPNIAEPPSGPGVASEAYASPEPRGSTAADHVGAQSDPAEESEGEAAPDHEQDSQRRRGWWQGPER